MKNNAILLMATLIVTTTPGCSSRSAKSDPIKRVKADTVNIYNHNQAVTFPGKIRAASDVSLAFRVSGTLQRVNTDAGNFVRKGQVLAELDPRDYQTQLAATEAKYKQVKGESERIIGLYEKGSVAPNEYEKALYGLDQITAQYNAHKNALEDTRLRAPFDGYVQKKLFDRNETVSAGMPVISMISSDRPEVEINLPASDFMERERFESFTCTVDIFPGKKFELEPVGINQKANLNQLYTMRLRLKHADGNKMPPAGMSAMVTINYKAGGPESIIVPITAMFEKDGLPHVWIYNPTESTVSGRQIALTEILANGNIVISNGLENGDIVVTAGVNSLTEKDKVLLLQSATNTNVGGML